MNPGDRTESPALVMCFGASDPSGAEGVQCDLLTLAGQGVHPLTVVTAIFVRDTAAAESILIIDADWVEDQCRVLLEDMPIAAFKVGAQVSIETVAVIAEVIADYPDVPMVLHPQFDVADATGNASELADATRELLLPQTDILVVSIRDAAVLVETIVDEAAEESGTAHDELEVLAGEPDATGRLLLAGGCAAVLLTGVDDGTGGTEARFYREGAVTLRLPWATMAGGHQRGAMETLSAALTGLIGRDTDWAQAVRQAQAVAWQASARSFNPGMGARLPDRLFPGSQSLPNNRHA